MKKRFPGYFRPSKEEVEAIWAAALFAFDANFLLNVYRYTADTQQKMLSILERLKNRVWIPHQAALEFHRNRKNVIATQAHAYDEVKNAINEVLASLKKKIDRFSRHPFLKCDEIASAFDETRKSVVSKLDLHRKSHPDLRTADPHLDALVRILADENVGAPFDENRQADLRAEAERRHKQQVPPGFLDSENRQHPYGDYYVWRQLLDAAREKQRPIIFVTDEKKEDWWANDEGKRSPRPELVQEMYESSGCVFYMYRSDQFIKLAGKHVGVDVADETLREVRDIGQQGELRATTMAQSALGIDPAEVLGRQGRPMSGRPGDVRNIAGTQLRHTDLEIIVADDSLDVAVADDALDVAVDTELLLNTPKDPDAK